MKKLREKLEKYIRTANGFERTVSSSARLSQVSNIFFETLQILVFIRTFHLLVGKHLLLQHSEETQSRVASLHPLTLEHF